MQLYTVMLCNKYEAIHSVVFWSSYLCLISVGYVFSTVRAKGSFTDHPTSRQATCPMRMISTNAFLRRGYSNSKNVVEEVCDIVAPTLPSTAHLSYLRFNHRVIQKRKSKQWKSKTRCQVLKMSQIAGPWLTCFEPTSTDLVVMIAEALCWIPTLQ